MWLVTKRGFLSVVSDRDNENRVLVRARALKDLENIISFAKSRGIAGIERREIFKDVSADYRYRVFISKNTFGEIASLLAEDIDYDNFKNEVGRTDPERAYIYSDVWHSLFQIQKD